MQDSVTTTDGPIARWPPASILDLPSALDRFDDIAGRIGPKRLAMFLDYDGTLTPIVDHPENALLADRTRETISRLSRRCLVAIISGRDLESLRHLVSLDRLYYAGSHGFDIEGPEDSGVEHQVGLAFLPALDRAEAEVAAALSGIEGVLIERKKFAVAVHYRKVQRQEIGRVRQLVEKALAASPSLHMASNKKVFELLPRLRWDKGASIIWLLQRLGLDAPDVLPICLGDDQTDEHAFRAIRDRGIAIVVSEESRLSAATYRLKNPAETETFLSRLI